MIVQAIISDAEADHSFARIIILLSPKNALDAVQRELRSYGFAHFT
ncbi:hypothetical protein GW750_02975 [bacterium]|nr:hypothetical protein [bacterium]